MILLLTTLFACTGADPKDDAPTDDAPTDTDPTDATTDPSDDDGPTDASTDSTDVEDDAASVTLDGTCDDADHWGAFTVDANIDYAYVSGSVANGVVPITVLTRGVSEGDCTIWRRENPFCDGGCAPGATCGLDGSCVPYPLAQDVGTVTVAGLSQPVSMTPRAPGNSYYDTSLANPPWRPGDLLTLTIPGGDGGGAVLHGVAPDELAPTSLDWHVVPGEAFTVTWAPPADGARTEIVLGLRVDQHGLTPSQLRCVFEDDGEGTVPTSVLDELFALGLTGFPAGDLIRRTADKAPIGDGCVDLITSSTQTAALSIEGYTPCRLDNQCPRGQECNEALERCE
jgi:hypothetical protein